MTNVIISLGQASNDISLRPKLVDLRPGPAAAAGLKRDDFGSAALKYTGKS